MACIGLTQCVKEKAHVGWATLARSPTKRGRAMFTTHMHLAAREFDINWVIVLIALAALVLTVMYTPAWQMPVPSAGPIVVGMP